MSGQVVLALRLLLALALYGFLALALRMMWLELQQTSRQTSKQDMPAIRLEVRAPRRAPVVRAFSQPELLLGRGPHADLRIVDRGVSERHAALRFHHGQWWLSDLGSERGTRLNRAKLVGPTVLMSGDEIECGQARVMVSVATKVGPPPSRSMKPPHA